MDAPTRLYRKTYTITVLSDRPLSAFTADQALDALNTGEVAGTMHDNAQETIQGAEGCLEAIRAEDECGPFGDLLDATAVMA